MILRGFLRATLVAAALLLMLAVSLFAATAPPTKDKGPGAPGVDSLPSVSIENEYIKAASSIGGRFLIGTTGGDPGTAADDNKRLLYGYPDNVGSSFSTLRVSDGSTTSDYRLGATDWVTGLTPVAPPTATGSLLTTTWEQDGVRVVERLSFAQNPDTDRPDTTAIEYTLTNIGAAPRSAGLRIMLDTMIGDNDGAPFFVPTAGNVTNQTDFSGSNIPDYWVAWESPLFVASSLKGRGQLIGADITRPDRFVIADWPQADNSVWDYTVDPADPVTNDSAVLIYFDPVELAPGASHTVSTYYGLAASGATRVPSTLSTDRVEVPADGLSYATLTLTLRDDHGIPLSGRRVRLISSRGSLDTFAPAYGTTDAAGRFQPQMRSVTPGPVAVQAFDDTTHQYIAVSVNLNFTPPGGGSAPPPNNGPIAILSVQPQHPLDARYLEGVPVSNRIDVKVDWKATAPGHVDFVLNGTTFREPPSAAGSAHTFNMGSDLRNGTNHLRIVAYNSAGQSSNPRDFTFYSTPMPLWMSGLVSQGLGSLPVLASGDLSGKGSYDMGFRLPPYKFSITAPGFGVPDGETELGFSLAGKFSIPLFCLGSYKASLTAGAEKGFKVLGANIEGTLSGSLEAEPIGLCVWELPHGSGAFEVSATRTLYRKPVLVMVAYFNAAVGVFVENAVVTLHIEDLVAKVLGEFYIDGTVHAGAEMNIDLPNGFPNFQFSDLSVSGGIGIEGGYRYKLPIAELKIWAGADGTVKFIRAGPVAWPPVGNWGFDSIILKGEVGAKLRALWWQHQATGSIEWRYPPGLNASGIVLGDLVTTDWRLLPHVTTASYAAFRAPVASVQAFATPLAGHLASPPSITNPITSVLVSNVYTFSEPSLAVETGGSDALLLWVHDVLTRPVGQSQEIYFSHWDGTSWHAPAGITDDDRMDAAPQVAWSLDAQAVALWQRLNAALLVSATLDVTAAQKIEIAGAVYSPTTGAWSPLSLLTDNTVLDMDPHLARNAGGRLLAAWRQNPAGQLLGSAQDPDRVMVAFYDGGWSAPAVAADQLPGVVNLAVGYGSSAATIAFNRAMTPTGGLTPTLQLYTVAWDGAVWSAPVQRTDDDLDQRTPQVVYNAANQPLVVWLAGEDLTLQNLATSALVTLTLPADIGGIDEFRVVQDANGNLALVFGAQANRRDLFISYYDKAFDLWGRPIRLTDDRTVEAYPAPAIAESDRLLLGYAATAVNTITRTTTITATGQVITYTVPQEGQTDLLTLSYTPGNNLAVGDLQVPPPSPPAPVRGIYTNTTPVYIPDDLCDNGVGPYVTSSITVTDVFTVEDVNVGVNLYHTYRGDLNIYLRGPDGTTVILHQRTNGSSENLDVLWDDQSPNGPLPSGNHDISPPFFENWYQPAAPLSTFDGKQSTGEWELGICDDYGGDVGTLNFWTLFLPTAGPPSASPLAAGSVLTATVANAGNFALAGVEVGFYDGEPGAGGTLIGMATVSEPLASGFTTTVTTTWTVPVAGGIRHLVAIADPLNAIPETDETDNATAVDAYGPDLVIVNGTIDHWGASQSGLVTLIRNEGTTSSPAAAMRFYRDAISGTLAVSDTLPPLAAGAVFTLTTPWDYGALAPGSYPLVAVVNQDQSSFPELVTQNNALTLTLEVWPDLVLSPLYLWLDNDITNTVQITAMVFNDGSVLSGDTEVAFYRDDPFDPDGLLFTRTLPGLAASGYAYVSGVWPTAPRGAHAIYAVVDPARTLRELTRTNNQASGDVSVRSLCPDFQDPPGVDALDITAIAGHWGELRSGENWQYDLDWDGDIDIADLGRVTAAWGTTCPSS